MICVSMTGVVPPEAEFSAPARQAGRERKNGDAHNRLDTADLGLPCGRGRSSIPAASPMTPHRRRGGCLMFPIQADLLFWIKLFVFITCVFFWIKVIYDWVRKENRMHGRRWDRE